MPPQTPTEVSSVADDAAQAAERLLAQLTLDEKVGMMMGRQLFWWGLFQLLWRDFYHRRPFPSGGARRLGIEGLRFVDGPRGVVLEGGATTFPVAMARGATWDPALEARVGDAIGREVRSFGANLYGGVCVNLLRHPAWGRAQETFGEDPVHVGIMGAALAGGVSAHAIACVKHFALNSIENARFVVDVQATPRVLHELYLPQFKRVLDAGAKAVMSAYNAVNGEWCGQSAPLLTDILKRRWGFEGFVLTDFVFGLRDARAAANAGQDLEMPFEMVFATDLRREIDAGRVPVARVDDAVRRILTAQLSLPPARDYGPVPDAGWPDHRRLSREVAARSFVLLKNDDEVLPLPADGTVGLFGGLANRPNLGDRGSSDGRPAYVITPRQGLAAALGDRLRYEEGRDVDAAARLAATVDTAVVVVGYDWTHEGEHVAPPDLGAFAEQMPPPAGLRWMSRRPDTRATWAGIVRSSTKLMGDAGPPGVGEAFGKGGDRASLALPAHDLELVRAVAEANPRTVVAVMAGSAVLMEGWREAVPGLLMLWYPGMEGGHAFADVLLGRSAPYGRLPFAIPTDAVHLPPFDRDARTIEYDLWHGYRRLARDGHAAAFPFGFGLTYTRFSLSNLRLSADEVAPDGVVELVVDVRNTGARDANHLVQVYVGALDGTVERPARELRAFGRLDVPAGETRPLTLTLSVADWAYFDEARDDFVVEPARYRVVAAAHAEDPEALEAEVRVVEPSAG